MPVAADAQNLQVDAARRANGLLVRRAIGIVIASDAAIRDMNVACGHVDVAEEIFAHEIVIALGMRSGKAEILVQIESYNLREIKRACLVQAREMLVQADHRVTGSEAKSEGWFVSDGAGDELRGLFVHLFVVALQDHQHAEASRYSLTFMTGGFVAQRKLRHIPTVQRNRRITRLCRSER